MSPGAVEIPIPITLVIGFYKSLFYRTRRDKIVIFHLFVQTPVVRQICAKFGTDVWVDDITTCNNFMVIG